MDELFKAVQIKAGNDGVILSKAIQDTVGYEVAKSTWADNAKVWRKASAEAKAAASSGNHTWKTFRKNLPC